MAMVDNEDGLVFAQLIQMTQACWRQVTSQQFFVPHFFPVCSGSPTDPWRERVS